MCARPLDAARDSRDVPHMKIELVTVSVLAGVVSSFVATGCSSGGGSCSTKPCGGNVVGNWKGSSACVDQATLNMEFLAGVMDSCPDASLGNVTMMPTGTIGFAADMTFTGTLAVNATVPINFPASCTNGATCAQLTQALQAVVGMNGITSVTCAGASSCVCTMAQTQDIFAGPGTWSSSGTTLTIAGTTAQDDGPYCVQGSSLHLVDLDMPTMMKVVGGIILSKQ